jgi:hypothetical protein
MNALDPHSPALLVAVMVIALLAIAAWVHHQRHQSKRLEDRFGNEYYRMLDQVGDRGKAEAELRAREKRVEKLHIIALSPADADRFAQDWKSLQARFVDNPKGALVEADRLMHELMLKRGYPMGDFERRAADISVDHPKVVSNYRTAHDITERSQSGVTSTEDLRKALLHYRALFDELLEVESVPRRPPLPKEAR